MVNIKLYLWFYYFTDHEGNGDANDMEMGQFEDADPEH